jgi:cytochrome c556
MNRKSKHLAMGLIVAAAGVTSIAMAAMKPEDAIHARQSIMRVMGLNFGPLAAMAQGKIAFNKHLFTANALRLEAVWQMDPAKYFLPGTDKPVPGSKIADYTNAKSEIWSEPAKFKKAAEHANEAIMKLARAARSGDEEAMKSAAGGVGKACKGCHDDFHAK